MRWKLCLALTALAVLALGCGGPDSGAVRIATVGNYHPFNFINDAGALDGMEPEMGDELCRRAQLECAWVIAEWDAMIPDLTAEKFDVILAGMSITAERDETIDFTQPYYPPSPSAYLARAGAGADAVEGTMGVFGNSIHSDYLTERGTSFVAFDLPQAQVDAVLNGEVDATLVDHGFAMQKMREFPGQLAIAGPRVELDRGLGIGVREESALKGKFDAAIASMKADGSLNALIRKWVGEDAAVF